MFCLHYTNKQVADGPIYHISQFMWEAALPNSALLPRSNNRQGRRGNEARKSSIRPTILFADLAHSPSSLLSLSLSPPCGCQSYKMAFCLPQSFCQYRGFWWKWLQKKCSPLTISIYSEINVIVHQLTMTRIINIGDYNSNHCHYNRASVTVPSWNGREYPSLPSSHERKGRQSNELRME